MTRRSRFAASVLLTTGLIGGGAQAGAQEPLVTVTGSQGCPAPAPQLGGGAQSVTPAASASASKRRAVAEVPVAGGFSLAEIAAGVAALLSPLLIAVAPVNWADVASTLGGLF